MRSLCTRIAWASLLQHVRDVFYMIKFIHVCNVIYVRFTSRTWLPCELHSVDTPGVYLYRVRPYSSNLDICIYICVLITWLVTNMVDGVRGDGVIWDHKFGHNTELGIYESSVIRFIHRNIASNTGAHYSNHLNTVVLHHGSWMDDCDCMMAYSISICQYAINRPCYDKCVPKCQYVLLGGWWCATQSPTEHMVSLYMWGPF